MSEWIQAAAGWLWGVPMLALVLGVGLYLFLRLRMVQLVQFPAAVRGFLRRDGGGDGDVSPFAALMTAVGGIVGNGNIAGVATAITTGGPGALFWMWVSGVVGMGTMFAESVLGVRFRHRGADGLWVGGPMYYMRDGLGWKGVAAFFAFGMAAKTLLATTTVQGHSIASAVHAQVGWDPLVSCAIVAALTAAVLLGGIRSIGRVAGILTPFMGILYLTGAAAVLLTFASQIPQAIDLVLRHAFTPIAGVGGFLGAGVRDAFRFGVARGVYSNEAGTGSVPIAHASARAVNPVDQGRMAMLGVFLDTLVVCTATGLVILCSGAWTSGATSTALVSDAFGRALGDTGGPLVVFCSFLFGLSTLIAWAFYGEQCAAYLFGPGSRIPFRVLYCLAILGGSLGSARATWAWADLLNGIMTIPNLIALLLLGGGVRTLLDAERTGTPAEA